MIYLSSQTRIAVAITAAGLLQKQTKTGEFTHSERMFYKGA